MLLEIPMKTHHADDETLEYIASLEQRNAELERKFNQAVTVLREIAKPALGGKLQQYAAQEFLAKTKE
jgi:hypothetical protein